MTLASDRCTRTIWGWRCGSMGKRSTDCVIIGASCRGTCTQCCAERSPLRSCFSSHDWSCSVGQGDRRRSFGSNLPERNLLGSPCSDLKRCVQHGCCPCDQAWVTGARWRWRRIRHALLQRQVPAALRYGHAKIVHRETGLRVDGGTSGTVLKCVGKQNKILRSNVATCTVRVGGRKCMLGGQGSKGLLPRGIRNS